MARIGELPPLPLDAWEDTQHTLHLYLQVIGKLRLLLHPPLNHWWHVPLYVSSRGLTTGPIPRGTQNVTMEFDLIEHTLSLATSAGKTRKKALGSPVADFFTWVMTALAELGIDARVDTRPFDMPDVSTVPFEQDTRRRPYDGGYAHRYWTILVAVDGIFKEFRGRFLGKSTPVHLFWHHMDLALTLFSGRPAPPREGAGIVEREAYSHEVISFGFWAGDRIVRAPAFYGYAAPPPDGFMDEPLEPAEARWNREAGMALLMYDNIRQSSSPRAGVLAFLESVYLAGARRAGWDVDGLRFQPV